MKIRWISTSTILNSSSNNNSFKSIASGTSLLLCGIAFLTLNERRDVAMEKLRQSAKLMVQSFDEEGSVEGSVGGGGKEVYNVRSGQLIHYIGTLSSNSTAFDYLLGVGNPNLVALRRKTEMYQWKETEHKVSKKEKDGTQTTTSTYTYDKVWSDKVESSSHDPERKNPSFPSGLPPGIEVITAPIYSLGKQAKLVLNDDMVSYITSHGDWKPLPLDKEFWDASKPLDYGLKVNRNRTAFSNAEGLLSNRIGDLRISYDAIFTGPYTAVAKVVHEDGKSYLEPFQASLKDSLGSQGAIEVPSDINDLVGIELDSFIIPEAVVTKMESLLLNLAPLHINYIDSGRKSLDAAFQLMATRDKDTLWYLRVAGTAMIWTGIFTASTPIGAGGLSLASATIGAAVLAYKTIDTARPRKKRRGTQGPDIILE